MLGSKVAHASRLRLYGRWAPARDLSTLSPRSNVACSERSRAGVLPAISSTRLPSRLLANTFGVAARTPATAGKFFLLLLTFRDPRRDVRQCALRGEFSAQCTCIRLSQNCMISPAVESCCVTAAAYTNENSTRMKSNACIVSAR